MQSWFQVMRMRIDHSHRSHYRKNSSLTNQAQACHLLTSQIEFEAVGGALVVRDGTVDDLKEKVNGMALPLLMR